MNRATLLAGLVAMVLATTARCEEWPGVGEWPSRWLLFPGTPSVVPASGLWKLEYDNAADGQLQAIGSLRFALDSANGQLAGRAPDAEHKQPGQGSVLTGQVIAGSPPIVSLRQDERGGRTVVYIGRLLSAQRIAGSYLDSHGGGGEWAASLVTDTVLKPLAEHPPDEILLQSVLGVYGKAIRGERYPLINLRPPHRDLWTDEIQQAMQGRLTYEEVDYLGTAKLVIPEPGTYAVEIPGAGVEFRINGQRIEAGEIELAKGMYEVEIYTNHWGQPYLTYAEVSVRNKAGQEVPFVNTESDIQALRSSKIGGQRVREVCKYRPARFDR